MPGRGEILREGKDITIITCSSMVANTLDAAEILSVGGIEAEVINLSTIKPIDKEIILASSAKTKKVVTVEEHSIVGGLGSAVAEVLISFEPVKMKMIGINNVFSVVGDYKDVIDYYGLTPTKISQSIMDFLKKL